jgi:hypothetical protein
MAIPGSVLSPSLGCKGFAFVKRLLAASAIVATLTASTLAAHAASTRTGAAQIQFTSAATATLAIVTQYNAAFAQGLAVPTLLPSQVGVCAPSVGEVAFTVSFGSMTPRSNAATACLYKNALAVSVSTNDANGFAVNEYLDTPPSNGVGICAYPNGGASFPLTPAVAPVPASTQSGNPAPGTFTGSALTNCPGGGGVVPTGAGGLSSGGVNPGNPGTAGLEFYSPSSAGLTMMSLSGPTLSGGAITTMYGAEDLQVNMGPGVKSMSGGATGSFLTIQLVLN